MNFAFVTVPVPAHSVPFVAEITAQPVCVSAAQYAPTLMMKLLPELLL